MFSITTIKSGDGDECEAVHGQTQSNTCSPGEDECPDDIDCDGSWSVCGTDCSKTFTVSVPQSGQGSQCDYAHGTSGACGYGEGQCVADIDCVGDFGNCRVRCRKTFSITTIQSGNGAQCEHDSGYIGECSPGEGKCPLNTPCEGEWSSCDADCLKTFTVTTQQGGEGASCEYGEGTSDVCDYGEDEEDLCEKPVIHCSGNWGSCTAVFRSKTLLKGREKYDVCFERDYSCTVELFEFVFPL
jgi:hypothetical protein